MTRHNMEDLECGIKKGREQTIWNQFSTNIMILEPVGSTRSRIIPCISSIYVWEEVEM